MHGQQNVTTGMSHLEITLAVNKCPFKRDVMDRDNVQTVILFNNA